MRLPEGLFVMHPTPMLILAQGFVIIEYMTGPKSKLQSRLEAALDNHGGAVGYAAQDFSLVIGGLKRRPDVAFWAVRPTDAQLDEPEKLLCPPPNLWIEVSTRIPSYIFLILFHRFVVTDLTTMMWLMRSPRFKTTSSQFLEQHALWS